MMENEYLQWLAGTAGHWWTDSAVLEDMDAAVRDGATGVTTNPLLVKRSLYAHPETWEPFLRDAPSLKGDAKAEEIIRRITVPIAGRFRPVWKAFGGRQGFVCAQVNPCKPGDADGMLAMARRLAAWADNIAVKLPATAAGLDAIEECAALGIATVGTVSFTVPQAVETARRQHLGARRAEKAGIKPGAAFSVLMVGRLDDYLRDVAQDSRAAVRESDIRQAGTAAIKRAYALVREAGYASVLMPAGMRGGYHAVALAGAAMSMSLSGNIQEELSREADRGEHIGEPVTPDVIERLMTLKEFRRAYEPDGMTPGEFIAYGATQRTLTQFVEAGWLPILGK